MRQSHHALSRMILSNAVRMQANARVCENGTLRAPAQSDTFRGAASTVSSALRSEMHPEYEMRGSSLQLGEVLGEGEFGIVHRARWNSTPVAVKVLRTGNNIRVEELASEIVALCKVHHPNVVHFLGAVTQQEPYLIVTEIMEGDSLEAALRRGTKFGLRRALEIVLDCARGLEYLHLPNPISLMHRDLKPSNVMFAGNGVSMGVQELALDTGVAKLTDFGLSKSLNAGAPRAGALRGVLGQDGRFTVAGLTEGSVHGGLGTGTGSDGKALAGAVAVGAAAGASEGSSSRESAGNKCKLESAQQMMRQTQEDASAHSACARRSTSCLARGTSTRMFRCSAACICVLHDGTFRGRNAACEGLGCAAHLCRAGSGAEPAPHSRTRPGINSSASVQRRSGASP